MRFVFMVVAYALFLIGIVAFGIGVVGDSVAWIFVSIVSTAAAGVVIFAARRRDLLPSASSAGRGAAVAAPAGRGTGRTPPGAVIDPAPSSSSPPPPPPSAWSSPSVVPAPGGRPSGQTGSGGSGDPGDDPREVAAASAPISSEPGDGRLFALPPRAHPAFPIADFDDLRVAEILPLLPRLDAGELAVVRGREARSKRRATILARIDELTATSAGPPAPGDAPAPDGEGDSPVADDGSSRGGIELAGTASPHDGIERRDETEPDGFPIPGYSALRVVDIVALLRALDPDQLAWVALQERRGAKRQAILGRIDDLLVARVRADGPPDRVRGAGRGADRGSRRLPDR